MYEAWRHVRPRKKTERSKLGNYIASERLKKNITQKELATMAGVTTSQLSAIESGNNTSPDLNILKHILAALGEPV